MQLGLLLFVVVQSSLTLPQLLLELTRLLNAQGLHWLVVADVESSSAGGGFGAEAGAPVALRGAEGRVWRAATPVM